MLGKAFGVGPKHGAELSEKAGGKKLTHVMKVLESSKRPFRYCWEDPQPRVPREVSGILP